MARVQLTTLTLTLDPGSLAVMPSSLTATEVKMQDAGGTILDFHGHFRSLLDGGVGGTITGFDILSSSGAVSVMISAVTLQFKIFVPALIANSSTTLTALFAGADTIFGSSGDDLLSGSGGADRIYGRAGDDTFYGDPGNDTLTGGGGADTFIFAVTGSGHDVITDFTDTRGAYDDVIEVPVSFMRQLHATEDAQGVLLTLSASSSIYVQGWTLAKMGPEDFHFA